MGWLEASPTTPTSGVWSAPLRVAPLVQRPFISAQIARLTVHFDELSPADWRKVPWCRIAKKGAAQIP